MTRLRRNVWGTRAPARRPHRVGLTFAALTAVLGVAASACGSSGPSEGALAGKSATAVLSLSIKAYHRQTLGELRHQDRGWEGQHGAGRGDQREGGVRVGAVVDGARPPSHPRRRVGLPARRDAIPRAAAQPVDRSGGGARRGSGSRSRREIPATPASRSPSAQQRQFSSSCQRNPIFAWPAPPRSGARARLR